MRPRGHFSQPAHEPVEPHLNIWFALQTKTAAQCGSIQGTTMFNETAATAQLDAVAGAFAGMPWSAVGAGVAAAQAQLQAAYSSTVINAGPVRASTLVLCRRIMPGSHCTC